MVCLGAKAGIDGPGELVGVHSSVAAQQLLAAVVQAGGSRQVVAAAAAALWRLAICPDQAAESAACPMEELEQALGIVSTKAGASGRMDVVRAKAWLRGAGFASFASAVGKLSKSRNARAHPPTAGWLLDGLQRLEAHPRGAADAQPQEVAAEEAAEASADGAATDESDAEVRIEAASEEAAVGQQRKQQQQQQQHDIKGDGIDGSMASCCSSSPPMIMFVGSAEQLLDAARRLGIVAAVEAAEASADGAASEESDAEVRTKVASEEAAFGQQRKQLDETETWKLKVEFLECKIEGLLDTVMRRLQAGSGLEDSCEFRLPGLAAVPDFPRWGQDVHCDGVEAAANAMQKVTAQLSTAAETCIQCKLTDSEVVDSAEVKDQDIADFMAVMDNPEMFMAMVMDNPYMQKALYVSAMKAHPGCGRNDDADEGFGDD